MWTTGLRAYCKQSATRMESRRQCTKLRNFPMAIIYSFAATTWIDFFYCKKTYTNRYIVKHKYTLIHIHIQWNTYSGSAYKMDRYFLQSSSVFQKAKVTNKTPYGSILFIRNTWQLYMRTLGHIRHSAIFKAFFSVFFLEITISRLVGEKDKHYVVSITKIH